MDQIHWEIGSDGFATAITVPDWPSISRIDRDDKDAVLASCIAYLDDLRHSPRTPKPPTRGGHGLPYTCWTIKPNQTPRATTEEDEDGTHVWY